MSSCVFSRWLSEEKVSVWTVTQKLRLCGGETLQDNQCVTPVDCTTNCTRYYTLYYILHQVLHTVLQTAPGTTHCTTYCTKYYTLYYILHQVLHTVQQTTSGTTHCTTNCTRYYTLYYECTTEYIRYYTLYYKLHQVLQTVVQSTHSTSDWLLLCVSGQQASDDEEDRIQTRNRKVTNKNKRRGGQSEPELSRLVPPPAEALCQSSFSRLLNLS